MFTEALEGEETEPRGGHGLPTGPGRVWGCGAGGVPGCVGSGFGLGGKAGGCAQILWQMGAPAVAAVPESWVVSPSGSCLSQPAERWVWVLWRSCLWRLARSTLISRPQFPHLSKGKAKPR